jgi:geranylgeranyl diphosphate synthase type II
VHKKWDDNIGILSGDAMMVVAYQHLAMASPEALPKLFEVFSATALLVCEGQQKDMDYAHASNVSDEEYTEMIRCKTAVLLGGAMQLGAIVAGASDANLKQIGVFAEDMGLAFQLRDDFLDTFGDAESFGKDIGGDIREGKRTWLTIKAYELGSKEDRKTLDTAFANEDLEQRIKDVMSVYDRLGIKERLQAEIERYSALSSKALDAVEGNEEVKDVVDLHQGRIQRRIVEFKSRIQNFLGRKLDSFEH